VPPKTFDSGVIQDQFIGSSPEARRINRATRRFASIEKNILMMGDHGTGKEFCARLIHAFSRRRSAPFVMLDCEEFGRTLNRAILLGEEREVAGAIQRNIGIFEKANRGVLFLKNLHRTPQDFQFTMTQVLAEGKFRREGGKENIPLQVRVISASDLSIDREIVQNNFRKDLYYMLKPLAIHFPSLRTRKQDIPELMLFFLKRFCFQNNQEIPAIPAEMFESILEYDWPGNIRELRDCVENLVTMSPPGALSTKYLPFEIKRHPFDFLEIRNLNRVVKEVETYLIGKALNRFAGNQVKAARQLGIPEATLRFKIRKYAIQRDF